MATPPSNHATVTSTYVRHGAHVDTIESVDVVFRAQRKLSFTYGAVFFAVTLAVPALTLWAEGWWKTTVWGGFTWNYLFISLLYYVFLWIMAWTYGRKADALDEKLIGMAEGVSTTPTGRSVEPERGDGERV